jgi:hypothetical protein
VLPNPPCLNETLGARTYGCFTSLNETQVASRIDEQRLSLASDSSDGADTVFEAAPPGLRYYAPLSREWHCAVGIHVDRESSRSGPLILPLRPCLVYAAVFRVFPNARADGLAAT